MKVNYLTYLPLNESSGGQSGVNAAVYKQLSKRMKVCYNGEIFPGHDQVSKIKSKVLRKLGLPGDYAFFSDKRLGEIAKLVEAQVTQNKADLNYFHSFTPWISYKSTLPYITFNDACFATYVSIYNKNLKFKQADLHRIYDKEGAWLSNAHTVFFRSQWALDKTVKAYGISAKNLKVTGPAGFIDIPATDVYKGGYNFTFIAKEFIPKGGQLVVDAIRKLALEVPTVKLNLIGDLTEAQGIHHQNIDAHGVLKKSDPEQNKKFVEILEQSFALVHPTSKDVNPLVIPETGYYGVPVIAPKSFAIPELVIDGYNGLLMDTPFTSEDVYHCMKQMIKDKDTYMTMRKNARERATDKYTWNAVGNDISEAIHQAIN